MLTKVLLIVALLIVVPTSNCQSRVPERGRLMDRWETEHDGFKIRVTEYEEKNPTVLTSFFYVFESVPVGENHWSEVMTFVHTDDVGLLKDQVRFGDDRIAYFCIAWKYAVTTDGGRTWSQWDAEKELPDCNYCNYQLIRDVKLHIDGTGRMMLDRGAMRSLEFTNKMAATVHADLVGDLFNTEECPL